MNLRNRIPQKIGITPPASPSPSLSLLSILPSSPTLGPLGFYPSLKRKVRARPLSYGRVARTEKGVDQPKRTAEGVKADKKKGGCNGRNGYFGTFVSARMKARMETGRKRGRKERRRVAEEGGWSNTTRMYYPVERDGETIADARGLRGD